MMVCFDDECDCPCHNGPTEGEATDWLRKISDKWLDDRERISPSQQFNWLMEDLKRWLEAH